MRVATVMYEKVLNFLVNCIIIALELHTAIGDVPGYMGKQPK